MIKFNEIQLTSKKTSFTFLVLLLLNAISLFAQINRYEVKSAIIEYDISGSRNMMGIATKISGSSSKVFFKNYGAIELTDETSNQKLIA